MHLPQPRSQHPPGLHDVIGIDAIGTRIVGDQQGLVSQPVGCPQVATGHLMERSQGMSFLGSIAAFFFRS